jgi:hypothetical protein
MTECATRVGGHLVDDERTHIPPVSGRVAASPHHAAARLVISRNGNATGNMNSGQTRWYGARTFIGVALGGGRLP